MEMEMESELFNMLPSVIENLRKADQLEIYYKFCNLISKGEFPLRNICYLLFLDLVNWLSCDNSCGMRYEFPETQKFWEVGYTVFHGKFLRFMSGPRNTGAIIEGREQRGACTPSNSRINFAAPSRQNINFEKKTPIFPGIMHSFIQCIHDKLEESVFKLGIDGKKISRGKGKSMGDVDCWGFESEPTLAQRRKRHELELEWLQQIEEFFNKYEMFRNCSLENYPSEAKTYLLDKLRLLVREISLRLKDLRENELSLRQSLSKFMEIAGSNWRKSRFFPLISSIQTSKYETDLEITKGLQIINKLCHFGATLNGVQDLYVFTGPLDLTRQGNYFQLADNNHDCDLQYIKQRSEPWFSARRAVKITGSTCNSALGLGTLKQQQAHYDEVFHGKDKPEPSMEVKSNMEYGTKHEADGIATMVGKVLPFIFPELVYVEEGCKEVKLNNQEFMLVSPDGSFRKTLGGTPCYIYENKCKTRSNFTADVYYRIPKYYVPQLLCEMHSYGCDKLLFTCWSEKSMVVFNVQFDEHLWNIIWSELVGIYNPAFPSRPSRLSPNIPKLKKNIQIFLDNHVSLIGEFPSLTVKPVLNNNVGNVCSTHINPPDRCIVTTQDIFSEEIDLALHECRKWFVNAYHLCRSVASEVLVFMLNDLDRKYHTEHNNAHPIAYAMKGSSLTTEVFRNMVQGVINACESQNLTIRVIATDGQWHKFGVRDLENKPLTKLQLQKDLWNRVRSETKSTLLSKIRNMQLIPQECHMAHVSFQRQYGKIIVFGHKTDSNKPIITCQIVKLMTNWDAKKQEEADKDNGRGNDASTFDSLISGIEEDNRENVLTEIDEILSIASTETSASSAAIPQEKVLVGEELIQIQPTNVSSYRFQDDDFALMLAHLSSHERSDKKTDWTSVDLVSFKELFASAEHLDKSFNKIELGICLKSVIGVLKTNQIPCLTSWPKYKIVNLFSSLGGNNSQLPQRVKKVWHPKSLKTLCSTILQKVSKVALAAVVAQKMYQKYLNDWEQTSPIPMLSVEGATEAKIEWFFQPHYKPDNIIRFHFTDACHILTCLRAKICSTGIRGLNRKAWEVAALSPETNLNIAVVTEAIDKQSVAFARSLFDESVEKVMSQAGYHEEEVFCRLIRNWFNSEDEPGMPSSERCQNRLALREWLLHGVDFSQFPPPTIYIKGIPIITYEALLTHCERKVQMYPFCPRGTYNVRATGSQEVEQFFSTFRDLDPHGAGTPRPDDLPLMMGTAVELDNFRIDPNR